MEENEGMIGKNETNPLLEMEDLYVLIANGELVEAE